MTGRPKEGRKQFFFLEGGGIHDDLLWEDSDDTRMFVYFVLISKVDFQLPTSSSFFCLRPLF